MIVIDTVIMLNSFYNVLCLLHSNSIQFLVLSNPFLYFFYISSPGDKYTPLSLSLSAVFLSFFISLLLCKYTVVCVYVQTQTTWQESRLRY